MHNDDQRLNRILHRQVDLVKQRNAIMDNFFKYYNPFYRKKLKKIDAELNRLYLEEYYLNKVTHLEEKELYESIQLAREIIKKYSTSKCFL